MVKRLLALVALLLVAVSSYALVPTITEYRTVYGDEFWFPSKAVSCADAAARINKASPGYTRTGVIEGEKCTIVTRLPNGSDGYEQYDIATRGGQCPVNSTAVTGGCQCNPGATQSGSQCIAQPDACVGSMGKDKAFIRNWTVGYSRSPDESDNKFVGTVNRLPGAGNPVCMGGCKSVQQDASAPGWKAWISQTPTAQGLYRNSLDVPFTSTGETCSEGTGATAPIDPQTPEPQCPGYVGEVNGKPGCYGTAANPILPQPKDLPPVRPDAGNPPAGTGPIAPNTGASRTPVVGTGGPAGGPAGAAVGGKGGSSGGTPSQGGSGTVTSPVPGEEQAACGAPGQPVCDVKISEGEMPSVSGVYKEKSEELGRLSTVDNDYIKAKAEQQPERMWTFDFQLPTGCSSFQVAVFMGTPFTMDPCAHQAKIHDLMSMVWAAATAFCLIGMVGRTLRST